MHESTIFFNCKCTQQTDSLQLFENKGVYTVHTIQMIEDGNFNTHRESEIYSLQCSMILRMKQQVLFSYSYYNYIFLYRNVLAQCLCYI